MKQTFEFSAEKFHLYLLQTISANKSYRLSFEHTDLNRYTLFCPDKAIVIDCQIVPGNGITECYLSATSPFCVISAAHEQSILANLLSRLHTTIHRPVPQQAPQLQQASPVRRLSFRLKQKISLNI
jgi:hypothetical protein